MSGPVPGGVEPALQLAGAAVGEVAAPVRGGSTGYLVLCTSTYTGKKNKNINKFCTDSVESNISILISLII